MIYAAVFFSTLLLSFVWTLRTRAVADGCAFWAGIFAAAGMVLQGVIILGVVHNPTTLAVVGLAAFMGTAIGVKAR